MDSSEDDDEIIEILSVDSDLFVVEDSDDSILDQSSTFQVLTFYEVMEQMQSMVDNGSSVMQLPPNVTRILLKKYHWDIQKLTEDYFETMGTKDLLKKWEVELPKNAPKEVLDSQDCQVCFSESDPEKMTDLDCGHIYCLDCWSSYLSQQVLDEGVAESITCIEPDCKILVEYDKAMSIIKDPMVLQKYQKLITEEFVACSKTLRWCPGPGCVLAIHVETLRVPGVTCNCGYSFCLVCQEDNHDPIDCEMLKKWFKVNVTEFASASWIHKNTKPCPKCKAPIEKNAGCNHMTCRNKACHHEFCWICMRDWKGHSSCNVFQPPEANANVRINDPDLYAVRHEHYKQRYEGHKKSYELEKALLEKIRQLLGHFKSEVQKYEFKFLEDAVNILLVCRQVLRNTFVFAFFVKKSNESEMFEENQMFLERGTEALSRLLESEVSFQNLKKVRDAVIDKAQFCQQRKMALIQHIQEGFDRKFWEFQELV